MSVRPHPRHGLNPMLMQCYYCGEASGVALLGQTSASLRKALAEAGAPVGDDGEAPRKPVTIDKTPCAKCQDHMRHGVILLSVDPSKTTDERNPWRSGGWVVVTEEAVTRIFSESAAEQMLKRRAAFLEDEVWDALGLPRGDE